MKIWFQNRRYKTKRKQITQQCGNNIGGSASAGQLTTSGNSDNCSNDDDVNSDEDLIDEMDEENEDNNAYQSDNSESNIENSESRQKRKASLIEYESCLQKSENAGTSFSKNFYKMLIQDYPRQQHLGIQFNGQHESLTNIQSKNKVFYYFKNSLLIIKI